MHSPFFSILAYMNIQINKLNPTNQPKKGGEKQCTEIIHVTEHSILRLQIYVNLRALLTKQKKQADELQETIDQLEFFDLKVKFSMEDEN